MNLVITKYDSTSKRIDIYQAFTTEAEADTHLASIIGTYPDAFVADDPGGGIKNWLVDDVDPNNKTLSNSSDAALVAAEALQAVIDARTADIDNGGYGTAGQQAALIFDTMKAEQGSNSQKIHAGIMALYNHAQTVKDNHPKPI